MDKDAVVNLGWANGWKEDPAIVKRCRELGHDPMHNNLDRSMHGLNTEVRCDVCGYVYHYDSSG